MPLLLIIAIVLFITFIILVVRGGSNQDRIETYLSHFEDEVTNPAKPI